MNDSLTFRDVSRESGPEFREELPSFGAAAETDEQGEVSRTSPDYVRWVQSSLNRILGTRLAVDGRLGALTRSAVRSFQRQRGLAADGVVGSRTEAALVQAGAGQPPAAGAAPPSGGGGRINTPLPRSVPGLYSYKPTANQFGLPETIQALQAIGAAWQQAHPEGPRIGIGDISLQGGGRMPGHASHQRGVDIDLRLVRNDGRETTVVYQSPAYSRSLTQELVNLIRANGVLRVQYIFFNDPQVRGVSPWPNHDNHLHVRFFAPAAGRDRELEELLDLLDPTADGTTSHRSFPALPGSRTAEQLAAEVTPSPASAAAAIKGSACAYFFKKAGYVRYNIATDKVDVGPVEISRFWNLPEEFHSGINAAVNWGDGHAYFFKAHRYVRFNIATGLVDVGPVEISKYWNLPKEFLSGIDAAVNWGNGKVYFFRKARYLRYDIASNAVDVGPVEISRYWKLPKEFHSGINAAVNWGDGHAYFFKAHRYLRFNIATDLVDVGPVEISKYWNLPKEFQSGIDAAVNWTFPMDLAALMRAAGLTVNEVGDWRARHQTRPSDFTPVGIMIHHTVGTGPGSLQDIVTNIKANIHIGRTGLVSIVSGGRSNHAGMGAQEVLNEVNRGIAPTGTAAQRGLRDAVMGNGFFYGFENENRGDGIQPWPAVQLDAMARAAAALCQVHCWSADRVIGHKEWTSRKIDPRGIDMDDFRARVEQFF